MKFFLKLEAHVLFASHLNKKRAEEFCVFFVSTEVV